MTHDKAEFSAGGAIRKPQASFMFVSGVTIIVNMWQPVQLKWAFRKPIDRPRLSKPTVEIENRKLYVLESIIVQRDLLLSIHLKTYV